MFTVLFFCYIIKKIMNFHRCLYPCLNQLTRRYLMDFINPYLYGMRCVSGKWKTTILHHIYTYGSIRFNETKKTLPVSEKVLSQQLKELERDGLIRRIQYQVMPLKVEYVLTPIGEELIPALDLIYIWSIKRMHERGVPIDPDAFVVHQDERYVKELGEIMKANGCLPKDNEDKESE